MRVLPLGSLPRAADYLGPRVDYLSIYRASLFVKAAPRPLVPPFVARFRRRDSTSHGTTGRFRPLPRIKAVLTACFPGPALFSNLAGPGPRLGPRPEAPYGQ